MSPSIADDRRTVALVPLRTEPLPAWPDGALGCPTHLPPDDPRAILPRPSDDCPGCRQEANG